MTSTSITPPWPAPATPSWPVGVIICLLVEVSTLMAWVLLLEVHVVGWSPQNWDGCNIITNLMVSCYILQITK